MERGRERAGKRHTPGERERERERLTDGERERERERFVHVSLWDEPSTEADQREEKLSADGAGNGTGAKLGRAEREEGSGSSVLRRAEGGRGETEGSEAFERISEEELIT